MLLPLTRPLEQYASLWVPLFEKVDVPEALLHWGHPAAMTSVLFSMGLYGAFLGVQIRQGQGSTVFPGSIDGKNARELHPLVMGGAFFFFVLGGQGGLVLNKFFENPTLQSNHAVTAYLSLAALAIQATLPNFFPVARDAHFYLGTAIMALLFLHAAFGLQLATSF